MNLYKSDETSNISLCSPLTYYCILNTSFEIKDTRDDRDYDRYRNIKVFYDTFFAFTSVENSQHLHKQFSCVIKVRTTILRKKDMILKK